MKRCCVFFLTVLLLFAVCGCKQQKTDFQEPVSFYYCNDITKEEDFNNIFISETREGAGYTEDLQTLLSVYLTGPFTEELISPFPSGLSVISVQEADACISIVLSDQIATLTGLDLTIACTCLSMTIMELYSCNCVEISASTELLDEQESIMITRDILILADDTYTVSDD